MNHIYSVTNSYNEYEVLALYEGNVAQVPSPIRRGLGGGLVPYANAATTTLTPKIVGNYNGVFVKTKHYIIPVPSIVTSEDIAPGIGKALTTGLIKSLVITNGTNIPKTAVSQTSTGQLNINLAVYTGSITSKSPILKILRAVKHIQNTYSGTSLVNNDIISNILNKTTNEQLLTLGNATILKGLQPVSTKIDWRDLDPNCDIPDITIGSQTWAGCNSTLGVGLEWGQLDTDIGTNNYSGTGVCSGYSWNSYPCTVGNSNMASNAKANEWFTGSNSNGDYEVANIWGKFYLYSGATLGERDLIPDTLINPDNNSICPNGYHVPSNQEWEYAEEYLYDGTQNLSGCRTNNQLQQCITVGWYNHSTTNISTSIVEKLKLPLSGIRNKGPNHSYGNRGKTAKLWTSSYQYSSTPIEFYIVFNLDTLSHPGNNRFAPDSYAYNVRCIKD